MKPHAPHTHPKFDSRDETPLFYLSLFVILTVSVALLAIACGEWLASQLPIISLP
jgi:hypothetical protein